jgi:hypothetical protein
MGRHHGSEIYPLAVEDETVDVIRASHVLEHFPSAQVPEVVKNWAAKLKPGGVLKIAVPNFAYIAQAYLDGENCRSRAIRWAARPTPTTSTRRCSTSPTLVDLFRGAGLTDIGRWESDCEDCSRLPVSLNMRAVKPVKIETPFKIVAVMSLPRTHWTANFRCSSSSRRSDSAAGLRGRLLGAVPGARLRQADRGRRRRHPDDRLRHGLHGAARADADAADAAQSGSRRDLPDAVGARLEFGSGDGRSAGRQRADASVPRECSTRILLKLKTGHFGLTMIRASSLKSVCEALVPRRAGERRLLGRRPCRRGHLFLAPVGGERKDALRRAASPSVTSSR